MTRHQIVVLDVPMDDDDDSPSDWNWTGLLGSVDEVRVVAYGPTLYPTFEEQSVMRTLDVLKVVKTW